MTCCRSRLIFTPIISMACFLPACAAPCVTDLPVMQSLCHIFHILSLVKVQVPETLITHFQFGHIPQGTECNFWRWVVQLVKMHGVASVTYSFLCTLLMQVCEGVLAAWQDEIREAEIKDQEAHPQPCLQWNAYRKCPLRQSVRQFTSQSVSQAVRQSISQSGSLPVKQSGSQPGSSPISQSDGSPVSQAVCHSISPSVNLPGGNLTVLTTSKVFHQSVTIKQFTSQSVSQAVHQSVTVKQFTSQPGSSPVSQSARQFTSQSVSQSARWQSNRPDLQSVSQATHQSISRSVNLCFQWPTAGQAAWYIIASLARQIWRLYKTVDSCFLYQRHDGERLWICLYHFWELGGGGGGGGDENLKKPIEGKQTESRAEWLEREKATCLSPHLCFTPFMSLDLGLEH